MAPSCCTFQAITSRSHGLAACNLSSPHSAARARLISSCRVPRLPAARNLQRLSCVGSPLAVTDAPRFVLSASTRQSGTGGDFVFKVGRRRNSRTDERAKLIHGGARWTAQASQPGHEQVTAVAAEETKVVPDSLPNGALPLVGEDAGVFSYTAQKTTSWVNFTAVLAVVLAILYVIWLDPETGFGSAFIDSIASVSSSKEMEMVLILAVFAVVHSGGAALRGTAERVIGERAYRVLFAGLSLPLAVSAVVFFINHRYAGTQLWQLRTVPGVHEFVWAASFVSFFFLYPSTFNLLEVAAVDKPKVHMWETGIMRVTRHPQMTGQLIWCLAHTLWIGNSFTAVTSLALCAHHAFGVWHGDHRLAKKYGPAFEEVKKRTSIVPFAAILDGRQKLPTDYYKEFLRVPYFAIVGVTLGAYFSHPLMQQASHWLHW